MKPDDILKKLDGLIAQVKNVIGTRHTGGMGGEIVESGPMAGLRSGALSFFKLLFGESHPYYQEFDKQVSSNGVHHAQKGLAILQAARSEVADGWLTSVKGIIAAELFSDFLEMAEHLLDAGYKGPSGVMAGCVIEEHVRQLCIKNGLELYETKDDRQLSKKADRLNADLAKAEVYTKLDQKLITAWLDLRNKAAHGKFDEFSSEQVAQMILGMTELMARVSV